MLCYFLLIVIHLRAGLYRDPRSLLDTFRIAGDPISLEGTQVCLVRVQVSISINCVGIVIISDIVMSSGLLVVMGPKKPAHLTKQGMREQKKMDKARAKELVVARKLENKALRGQSLFRNKQGNLESYKDAGQSGSKAFGNMSSEDQEALKQLGRENAHLGATGGKAAWDRATPEERRDRMDAGANAFGKMTEVRQEEIIVIGQQNAHKGALTWTEATDEEKSRRKEGGAASFSKLIETQQNTLRVTGFDNCHLGAPGGNAA